MNLSQRKVLVYYSILFKVKKGKYNKTNYHPFHKNKYYIYKTHYPSKSYPIGGVRVHSIRWGNSFQDESLAMKLPRRSYDNPRMRGKMILFQRHLYSFQSSSLFCVSCFDMKILQQNRHCQGFFAAPG